MRSKGRRKRKLKLDITANFCRGLSHMLLNFFKYILRMGNAVFEIMPAKRPHTLKDESPLMNMGRHLCQNICINLECSILVRDIYKSPTTFVNVLLHL